MSAFLAVVPQHHDCTSVMDCIKKALLKNFPDGGQVPEFEREERGVIIRGIDEQQLKSLAGVPGIFTVQYVA